MTDSIALGADGQANQTLEVLRREHRTGALGQDVTILPGLELHADPELNLTGTWTSAENEVLEFDAAVQGLGGWVGLHLSVPAQSLAPNAIVGFAARIRAPEIFVARACLRSGREGGFTDCFFDKHLLFSPDEANHVDVLQVAQRDTVPEKALLRDLILFLPTENFRMSFVDWRVFVV